MRDYKSILSKPEYDFLRNNEHLGDNVALLGLVGSYGYGTAHEGSDYDFRGVATRTAREILTGYDYEQVVVQDNEFDVDTTIYTMNKYITMAANCNPNGIELLGLKEYAIMTDIGKLLVDNRRIFMSQMAAYKFSEDANSQLRRLYNKSARKLSQADLEAHILKSMAAQERIYAEKLPEGQFINLYLGEPVTEGLDKEILIDITLKGFPLRQFPSVANDFYNIVRSYDKMGRHNKKAIAHDKLNKHMCHLLRLYITGADILETGDIRTEQTEYIPLLKEVLSGKYIGEDSQPTDDFQDVLETLRIKLEYAKKHTELPVRPDTEKIDELRFQINSLVLSHNSK